MVPNSLITVYNSSSVVTAASKKNQSLFYTYITTTQLKIILGFSAENCFGI